MLLRNKGSKSKDIDTNVDGVIILDEDEQTKITNDIKSQAITQSYTHRRIFQYLFYFIAFIYMICIYFTIQNPYELEHQKLFNDKVSIFTFHIFYISSIYCTIIASNISMVRIINS